MNPNDSVETLRAEEALSRRFFNIAAASTAFAMGCMAAVIEALRQDAAGFTFHISAGTFMAFALGLAAGVFYWKWAGRSRWSGRVGIAILVVAGLTGFLYPLRFVPADKMADIGMGLVVAGCLITFWVFMLWRMNRFFEADTASAKTKQ